MVLIQLLISILLLISPVSAALALDAALSTSPESTVKTVANTGLSELGPRQAQLVDFVEKSTSQLTQLSEIKDVRKKHKKLTDQFEELQQQVVTLGDPTTWYVDRLSQVNNQFHQMRKAIKELQHDLTTRQKEVESIQNHLQDEITFWKTWAKILKQQKTTVPDKTVRQIKKDLTRLQNTLKKSAASILGLQEQIGSSQQKIAGESETFEKALEQIRKATFRKNSFSFFTPEFYAQLTPELWQQARAGLIAAQAIDLNYLQRFAWLLGLMALALIFSAVAIFHYRSHLQATKDWQFVLAHPWATASFAVVVGFTPLFTAPSALFHFALLTYGVLAVITLAVPLTENRRQARVLILAAFVLVLTTAFRLISLPQPLYRLYISLLALGGIPMLIWQIKCSLHSRGETAGRFYRFVLRIAVVVLFVSLVGQISGYMNFSFWLLQSTFETGMVMLFAHMAMRLGNGGINFLVNSERWAQKKFFQKFADEFATRLENLLRIIVVFYSLLYLLPVWRVFTSMTDAWTFFAQLAVQFGEQNISLRMVLLALISFYLAMQISWLLQAMSETQVFYRKAVDRGVRDAIKKLIHYTMVLIGFLFVISSLGMSLQNFVVVLGALGVGIGFGLQDMVNNFLSGLILLFERPVKVGDFIIVNEEWGTINKIGLRSTVVETIDHSEIIVPNSQLISEKVTNWTHSSRVARLVVPVGVAYGSDVTLVMQILTEVATDHPESVKNPAPSILFIEFGDSSLNFEIRVFVKDISSRFHIRSEILQQIDIRFREHGIEIPFPQHDLHLRSVDGKVVDQLKSDNPEG